MTTDPAEVFARVWNGPRQMTPKEIEAILIERTQEGRTTRPIAELWKEFGINGHANQISGFDIEVEVKDRLFIFTSPELPELLVIDADMGQAIDDIEPSIKAILELKGRP